MTSRGPALTLTCKVCTAAFSWASRANRAPPDHCSRKCRNFTLNRRRWDREVGNFEPSFWARVDKSGGPDACWPWTGARVPAGYGSVSKDNQNSRAHRVSFELTKGQIPAGMFVCHSCDNPPCANPKHLWLGTAADNKADCVAKGRHARGPVSGMWKHGLYSIDGPPRKETADVG